MKKKAWLLIVLMMSLLAGCEAVNPPPLMFNLVGNVPEKFPAEVTLDYFIPNDSIGLVGDDHYVTIVDEKMSRYHQLTIYPVEKKEDGYIVHGSRHEGYTIPDLEEFGYSGISRLDKQNGQIKILFPHENHYRNFFNGFKKTETNGTLIGMEGIYEYYGLFKAPK